MENARSMQENKIIPCPKCGKMPEFTEWGSPGYYRIECSGILHHPMTLAKPYVETIKTWNDICRIILREK